MGVSLTDAQIDHWRMRWEEMTGDAEWIAFHEQRDAQRLVVQQEQLGLLSRFLAAEVSVDELRKTYDHKTKTDWDVFGLKGMSGAMFLNRLVKYVPDLDALSSHLRRVLPLPAGIVEGREQMQAFFDFQNQVIETSHATKNQLQPARTPFFASSWWHIQKPEQWPIFYLSGRQVLESEGLYAPSSEPVGSYFQFRDCFQALASALGLKSWQLEHLLAWINERRPAVEQKQDATPVPLVVTSIAVAEDEPEADAQEQMCHTQVQWLLAKIGKKVGCRIWIAANDQSKEWQSERLGNFSIAALPALGMDSESQRIVGLIDVLWIKGINQIVAAFEIEHTTSIYSGLLRMSDLAALSPNLSFPLYIVTPADRIEKVRRELARPTFQALELHKRCGFFSFEALNEHAQGIMKWANQPSAIEELADRVDDVQI